MLETLALVCTVFVGIAMRPTVIRESCSGISVLRRWRQRRMNKARIDY